MSYGAQIKVGFARQASAGTAVTQPTSFHGFGIVSEDIGLEKEEVISQNLTGLFEEGAVYEGVNRVVGNLEAEVTPRNLGAMLAMVVNHSPVSVSSGSIRTLTFLPNTQDFSSTLVKAPWTMYKQFSDASSAEHFYDMQFGQIDFTLAQGALLRARITAAGGVRTATGIGSADIRPNIADVGRLFPWNVSSISYGGTGVDNFSELTVSLNENIDALYTVNGTLAPFKYTRNGFRQVSVNGTFFLTDRTFLNNFAADTQARLLITCISTRTAIQSGYYNTFTIDVPQAKITAFKPGASGPGEVSVNVTMRGAADPNSNYAVQFTQVSTYQAGF